MEAQSIDLTGIRLRDRRAAAQNVARIGGRVPESVLALTLQLLSESPDPDSALNLFERLTGANEEAIPQLSRHQTLLHYALTVFAYSSYLGETVIRNPDLFHVLLREQNLEKSYSREDFAGSFARFRARSLDTDITLLLTRFKRREYVRIMLRDVLKIVALAETTAEISALSDVLIEEALRDTDQQLRNRYGPPQHMDAAGRLVDTAFTVLSLGKLGGNELNYSSDIDLLFLYADGAEAPAATISNREYFIRLAQQLTDVLCRMSTEGAPFRIDLRLRPQGGEGEPAVGLSHALEYYQHRAADWELQALIKLRHSAGDQALGREFIRRVHPFVYTEQLNFAAIETALATREKIGQHRRRAVATRKAPGIDVKLDRGGIRDIEFLVQCLQRVYGGTELWLRSGGTLFSLQKLHDKGHISGKDFQELTTGYLFLRNIEHRLQLRHGQQTHRLPMAEAELLPIARMLRGTDAQCREFLDQVRRRMAAVAEIYGRIIHHQQAQQQLDVIDFKVGDSREDAHRQLVKRLAVDAPALFQLVQRPDIEGHTRRQLYRFLAAAASSAEGYRVVVRVPESVEAALPLFSYSEYLTDILVGHPEEIDRLAALLKLAPAANNPVAGHAGFHDDKFCQIASDEAPYGVKLARLRQHFRACAFSSGARDLLWPRGVYESLLETSSIAGDAVAAAGHIAAIPAGFAIFALGRLGTQEFDLLSDADLLFVRDEGTDSVEALRAAERVVEALSAYTRDGTVFPVDARLRPRGSQGELVVTPAQLDAYFEREAQAWEALTYTKLRHVTGAGEVSNQVSLSIEKLQRRFAADPNFKGALREMRSKLEKTSSGYDDVKTGPGGLYDLDFIVGALQVRHGIRGPGANLRERLQTLHERGVLDEKDWKRLDRHAQLLRTVEHVVRLAVGKSRKTLPVAGPARTACDTLCARILQREFPEGLDITLRFALVGVREIYNRVIS